MRCQQPPRARKVPLYFNGWLLFDDSCVKSEDGNWFLACQLLQDRTGAILNSFVTGFSVKKKHPLYGRLTLIHQLFIHSFIHSFFHSSLTFMTEFIPSPTCSPQSLVRATRAECPWQAEASYIVPVASKDAIPHASEGHRQG